MSLLACVIGTDGSGKSSTSRALVDELARRGLSVSGSGDAFVVAGPGEPSRVPGMLPVPARLALRFRAAAKRCTDVPALYAPLKLGHLLLQDSGAWRLGRRIGADVVVSDGNLLLNAVGRAGNYRRAASRGSSASRPAPEVEDVASLYRLLCDGVPLPPRARLRLPPVSILGPAFALLRRLGLRPAWLPDVVLFLDVSPAEALSRIRSRGEHVDAHENEADLAQAREGYLRAIAALRQVRGDRAAILVPCDGVPLAGVVSACADAVLAARRGNAPGNPA